MPDIPKRTCKICGRLSFGHKCRQCYKEKNGVPLSKYAGHKKGYNERFEDENLTIFEWEKVEKEKEKENEKDLTIFEWESNSK
jgi:hypothetical protein